VAKKLLFLPKQFFVRKLIVAFLFSFSLSSPAQQDSCRLRISLLTCTPGQELYTTFGHSAVRVFDSSHNTDLVFNYGTFDFYDPAFYKKFIKGKLLYFVSIDTLPSFLWEYQYHKRGVTEQVIALSCEEKQRMLPALFENAREENKYYRYDFNYDNCTTRLRDMLEKITGKPMQTKNILPHSNTTFRHLIHDYLNRGGQQWSKLGIDILLGSPLDKKITSREAMFLPDYLMTAFDSSALNTYPLVAEKKILLNEFEAYKTKSRITPLLVFGILFFIITALSIFLDKRGNIFFTVFDFLLFFLSGLIGVLLLYMWFATDHAMCKNNFNLLWALPFHLLSAFLLFKKKTGVKNYFRFIFFYSLALLIIWFLLPQQLNTALLPVTGIIAVRCFFISKKIAADARRNTE
jgi:hypothetical protein